MTQSSTSSLPSSDSDEKLANDFSDFFVQKISKIRDHLSGLESTYTEETLPTLAPDLPSPLLLKKK